MGHVELGLRAWADDTLSVVDQRRVQIRWINLQQLRLARFGQRGA
jgi:hypothetical protein